MSQALAIAPQDGDLKAGARLATLQAGGIMVRHQPAAPFDLAYDGDRPILLYSFGAGATHGPGAACKAGSFLLLRPGRPTRLSHPDPVEMLGFAYEPQDLPSAAEPAEPFALVDDGVRALAHETRRVLLREAAPDGRYVEALGRAILARALQVTREAAPQADRALISPFKLRRVVEHIEAHLPDRITVAELAQIGELSIAHFARLFRQTTGEAPHAFILSRRIARVQALLSETDLDLATIAYRTGFSSHAHMATAFKRKLGVTPAAYRAAMREAA